MLVILQALGIIYASLAYFSGPAAQEAIPSKNERTGRGTKASKEVGPDYTSRSSSGAPAPKKPATKKSRAKSSVATVHADTPTKSVDVERQAAIEWTAQVLPVASSGKKAPKEKEAKKKRKKEKKR